LTPVVTNAPVTATVSLPFTVFPSLVVVPDVMVKSAAITGVAKARQTKADVPRGGDLRDLEMACDKMRPLNFMAKKVSQIRYFDIRLEL
jgi:hypothetical protein